jgi:hypothetical protein
MFGNTDPDKFGNRKIAIGALHVLHAVLAGPKNLKVLGDAERVLATLLHSASHLRPTLNAFRSQRSRTHRRCLKGMRTFSTATRSRSTCRYDKGFGLAPYCPKPCCPRPVLCRIPTMVARSQDSALSVEVVQSLAVEVRRQANQVRWLMRTPLLEQRPKKTNVIAVSIAAGNPPCSVVHREKETNGLK